MARTALLLILLTFPAWAQAQRPPQRGGPWERDLLLFESPDGLTFMPPRTFVERAGVPSLARDAKVRLIAVFQWFPSEPREAFDRVAVAFSDDRAKTWTPPRSITVEGLPATLMRPFDPTLVCLDDGRFRLYFTSNNARGPGVPALYSAVSTDAIHYSFEPGQRFGVDGEMVVDCAVGRLGKTWHLYSPARGDGRGYHAVSDDGLAFKRLDDVEIDGHRQWLGNVRAAGDHLRFFGSGEGGVWTATSTDGAHWQREEPLGVRGGDPAAVQLDDRRLILIVTGEPHRDRTDPRH